MVPFRRNARDWLAYLACGGLILISCGASVSEQKGQTNKKPPAQRPASTSAISSPAATARRPTTPIQTYACSHSTSTDTENLCIQWQIVKASKNQAYWAKAAVFVSVGGTIAIALTLCFTASAARSASQSSKAALASLPRGYLFCEIGSGNLFRWTRGEDQVLNLVVQLKNFGSGPAILELIETKLAISAHLPDRKGSHLEEFLIDNIVPIGGLRKHGFSGGILVENKRMYNVDRSLIPLLAVDTQRLYIMARIYYRDIHDRRFETRFCVSYRTNGARLVPQGGTEYNWQT